MVVILAAGAVGGVVNALLSGNGFALPRREGSVWCPGILSNILVGASASFVSWALYGSGAAIDLAMRADPTARGVISLRASAIAGAFLVGIGGAKWLTNEVDKRLLRETVHVAATSPAISGRESVRRLRGSPVEVRRAFHVRGRVKETTAMAAE
jgi:hypothetical protein